MHTELPYSLKVHGSQLLRTFPDLVNCFPEVGHQCFYPFFVINNVMNVPTRFSIQNAHANIFAGSIPRNGIAGEKEI